MAVKVTKGQIRDGTISKNTCHKEYNVCRSFIIVHEMFNFWCYAALLYTLGYDNGGNKNFARTGNQF